MTANLDALRREAEALARAARRDPAAHVPSCPDWDVARLAGHTGEAYLWVTTIVGTHADAPVDELDGTAAPGEGVVEWFEERLAELVETITNEAPETPVWNWSERDFAVSWWARRMTNETAVHRWDAQLAVGDPEPIEPGLATDCVDETLTVFLPHALESDPVDGLAGTFAVVCTDTGDVWRGEIWPDHAEVRRLRGTAREPDDAAAAGADAVLRGTASNLALALWGRDVPVETSGDERITDLLTE